MVTTLQSELSYAVKSTMSIWPWKSSGWRRIIEPSPKYREEKKILKTVSLFEGEQIY